MAKTEKKKWYSCFGYFSKREYAIWLISVALILSSYFLFEGGALVTVLVSLLGATAILFNAKGNPFGLFLMIIFSIFYAVISYSFRYYGEMMTYLGMSAPMSLYSLFVWLRNPYKGKRSEVRVSHVTKKEVVFLFSLSLLVTTLFYFLLALFGTANLIVSTVSVFTTFIAVYFTARRSPYFSLAYAVNDIVLIVLWSLAAFEDISYLSVVVCFLAFLLNDLYAFYSWKRMSKRQSDGI